MPFAISIFLSVFAVRSGFAALFLLRCHCFKKPDGDFCWLARLGSHALSLVIFELIGVISPDIF